MDRTRLAFIPDRLRTDVAGARVVATGRIGTDWTLAIVDWED